MAAHTCAQDQGGAGSDMHIQHVRPGIAGSSGRSSLVRPCFSGHTPESTVYQPGTVRPVRSPDTYRSMKNKHQCHKDDYTGYSIQHTAYGTHTRQTLRLYAPFCSRPSMLGVLARCSCHDFSTWSHMWPIQHAVGTCRQSGRQPSMPISLQWHDQTRVSALHRGQLWWYAVVVW